MPVIAWNLVLARIFLVPINNFEAGGPVGLGLDAQEAVPDIVRRVDTLLGPAEGAFTGSHADATQWPDGPLDDIWNDIMGRPCEVSSSRTNLAVEFMMTYGVLDRTVVAYNTAAADAAPFLAAQLATLYGVLPWSITTVLSDVDTVEGLGDHAACPTVGISLGVVNGPLATIIYNGTFDFGRQAVAGAVVDGLENYIEWRDAQFVDPD